MAEIVRQTSGESSLEYGGPGRHSTRRQVIQDIGLALREDSGIAVAVARAAQLFDHHDVRQHDESIEDGAASSLYGALRHVVRQMNDLPTPLGSDNESRAVMISLACTISAFEMLFRCSEVALGSFYRQMGEEFVATMVDVMDVFICAEMQSSVIRQLLLKNAVTILCRMSTQSHDFVPTLGDLRSLLGVLVRTLQSADAPPSTNTDCATIIARLASQSSKREAMLSVSGLLDGLVSMAHASYSESTSVAVSALLNLSYCENNVVIMGESQDVFELLVALMIRSSPAVRQDASKTMRNIVLGAENSTSLLTRRNNVLLDAVVTGLQAEVDFETSDTCLRIVEHLLSDEVVIHIVARRIDLLGAVAGIAIKDPRHKTNYIAAVSLSKLAGVAVIPPDGCLDIIDNLVALTKSQNDDIRHKAAEALSKLSRPGNRVAMANQGSHHHLFQALTTLVLCGDEQISTYAIETVHNLSKEPGNREILCRDHNISQLLVAMVSGSLVVTHHAYVNSVSTILCLVDHGPNLKRLAKSRSLVPSLANFASSTTDGPMKRLVIRSVVLLSEASL